MDGIERIAAERRRQIHQEGYGPERDAGHDTGELAVAAAVYALPVELRGYTVWKTPLWRLLWPSAWHFKGAVRIQSTTQPRKSRIRELEKAGALIAAEIDRLLRIPG